MADRASSAERLAVVRRTSRAGAPAVAAPASSVPAAVVDRDARRRAARRTASRSSSSSPGGTRRASSIGPSSGPASRGHCSATPGDLLRLRARRATPERLRIDAELARELQVAIEVVPGALDQLEERRHAPRRPASREASTMPRSDRRSGRAPRAAPRSAGRACCTGRRSGRCRARTRAGSRSGSATTARFALALIGPRVGDEHDAVGTGEHDLARRLVHRLTGHRVDLDPEREARASGRRSAADRRTACGRRACRASSGARG